MPRRQFAFHINVPELDGLLAVSDMTTLSGWGPLHTEFPRSAFPVARSCA